MSPSASGKGDELTKFETASESLPASASILTGKQEHYLKRELVSQQTQWEISELSSPTALQRFGAPFRSDEGEVAPEDSQLPLLRYIFVHHIRNFPFLDRAKEKEFWQDKLQVFLESFATKHISTSDDRLEETKRHKLAIKAQKIVELMMVSGIPTASGYEERISFNEIEIVDRGAQESGLVVNMPEGTDVNGWDVNIASVRTTSVKRTVRHHQHAEFIIQVRQAGGEKHFVGRRYGDFGKLHKNLRLELPGKTLAPLPRKNKTHSSFLTAAGAAGDDSSISSVSTSETQHTNDPGGSLGIYLNLGGYGHSKRNSAASSRRISAENSRDVSPAGHSLDINGQKFTLYRESQRVSLRAFLRTILQDEQVARSKTLKAFLSSKPVTLNVEEMEDIERRKEMDRRRIQEQKECYEIARKRAQDLDMHMEKFRRDIVENNGLSKLFQEIREKEKIADLTPEYQKFAEWLRIEVAATIYHLFLAEDNSADLFAQGKRIHGLIPYGTLKSVIRYTNPAAVMKGVLDLFTAQPLGARSLLQRVFSMALNDGIKSSQRVIDNLQTKINDHVLCEKIKNYTYADEDVKSIIRHDAVDDQVDLLVAVLRTEYFTPILASEQVEKIFNAYVAWNFAVENEIENEMKHSVELYSHLKLLLKLYTRQRDKTMMMNMIEEPNTLKLFRDLFTIFYEPLVRVYKSANVYSSITDFAEFADDTIKVVEAAQRQDVSADPNQTVQSFIDLCQRHEDNLYKFIHQVHIHDNGLFDQIMSWLEGILEFLRHGPKGGKLDMNALFRGAIDSGQMDKTLAIQEIDQLIRWQTARKKWHADKTRQKMAADGQEDDILLLPRRSSTFSSSQLHIDESDIQDLDLDDSDSAASASGSDSEDDAAEALDPVGAERRRRTRRQDLLRRSAGEPTKPPITELHKLGDAFISMLRAVLAE